MDGADGLERLEASLARDFERLNHPPADWVPPRTGAHGRRMVDVAIVGAGMCGLAAGFALRRLGISNLRQVDRSPEGREGPWLTCARMETLRSPKHLSGPVQGVAGLTFRAWWEARGHDWEALGRISTMVWADYLDWYRGVTGARVENEVDVVTRSNRGRAESGCGSSGRMDPRRSMPVASSSRPGGRGRRHRAFRHRSLRSWAAWSGTTRTTSTSPLSRAAGSWWSGSPRRPSTTPRRRSRRGRPRWC